MKTKLFLLLTAAMLLLSVNVSAQTKKAAEKKAVKAEKRATAKKAPAGTPLKGDVNEDGVVDVADIAAVIAIMKNGGGTGEETKYYWYVGTTKPTSSTYTSSNMLWNGVQNSISFGSRVIPYIAVPYTPLQIWDSDGDSGLDVWTSKGTKDINNVTYYIYERNSKVAAFSFNIYNK